MTHIDGQLDAATTRGRERARMALLPAVNKNSKETRIIHMMRHSKRYDIPIVEKENFFFIWQ